MAEKTVSEIRINGIKCNINKLYWAKTDTTYIVESKYKVTFVANGSTYATKQVEPNETIGVGNMPTNPTRSGWSFSKWVYGTSNTQFTSATSVVSNLIVTAYWLKYVYSYPTCSKCNGNMTVTCSTCNGTGTVSGKCSNCGGSGTVSGWKTCPTCLGACYFYSCSNCGYSMEPGDTCPRCGGTSVTESLCSTCGALGEAQTSGKCGDCNGKGTYSGTCSTCDGDKEVKCSRCSGKGYTTTVDYVYEKY